MSVVGKVYDKILLKRSEPWFRKIKHDLQGSNREGCSSLHTALVLQEAISHNTAQRNTVYVALLDTQKAFDTVWQAGAVLQVKETQHGS